MCDPCLEEVLKREKWADALSERNRKPSVCALLISITCQLFVSHTLTPYLTYRCLDSYGCLDFANVS